MASIKDFKLLTIIIPTYNRCKQVEENINLVLPQIVRNKDKVRLYISDNASSDGTDSMVKPYLEQHPDVMFYYRQPQNITASPNFNHAVQAANSEYVFVLGDDDDVVPTFVESVLVLMNEHPDVGLIHFNYLHGLNDLKRCKVFQQQMTPSMKEFYPSGKEFILKHLNKPSFISSSLFKKQLWLDGVPYMKEDCPGYVWFSILLFGCLNYKCMYYQAPMLIQNFPANNPYSANWPLYYVYGLGHLFEYLDEKVPGVYNRWIKHQQKEDWTTYLIVLSGISGSKNKYKEEKDKMFNHMHTRVGRYYYSICLYLLPNYICKKILINIIRLFRIKNLIS